MSKLTTQSTFDVSQIADTNSFKELQSFFDYVNLLASDVVTNMSNNIDITNNIKFWTKTFSLKHGIPVALSVNPKFILLNSVKPILNHTLIVNSKGVQELTVYFKDSLNVRAINAIWVAGSIVKYTLDGNTVVNTGNFINISGFGTANNNGNFLVIEVDGLNVYCINYKRTSATGDESRQTYAGAAELSGSVTVGAFL